MTKNSRANKTRTYHQGEPRCTSGEENHRLKRCAITSAVPRCSPGGQPLPDTSGYESLQLHGSLLRASAVWLWRKQYGYGECSIPKASVVWLWRVRCGNGGQAVSGKVRSTRNSNGSGFSHAGACYSRRSLYTFGRGAYNRPRRTFGMCFGEYILICGLVLLVDIPQSCRCWGQGKFLISDRNNHTNHVLYFKSEMD